MSHILILHVESGKTFRFTTAREAAIFMWGRDQRWYQTYVSVKNLPVEVSAYEVALARIVLSQGAPE